MKAALIEVVGGAPRVETLGDPSRTGDDQVLIKVEAAALKMDRAGWPVDQVSFALWE
jgi:NADPH:quinone reductase-like Zn-dependent oxidoreductase